MSKHLMVRWILWRIWTKWTTWTVWTIWSLWRMWTQGLRTNYHLFDCVNMSGNTERMCSHVSRVFGCSFTGQGLFDGLGLFYVPFQSRVRGEKKEKEKSIFSITTSTKFAILCTALFLLFSSSFFFFFSRARD